jgi:hypothetical protein
MNNEQLFAHQVRLALDESADHLPFRITQRLEQSRLAALARAMPIEAELAVNRAAPMSVALHGDDRPSVYFRLLSTVAPILLVVAGLYGIDAWNDAEEAAEVADGEASPPVALSACATPVPPARATPTPSTPAPSHEYG